MRPSARVWTRKDLTPEGCTLTPKCASVPSQSVYSFVPGFAAVMVTCTRIQGKCLLTAAVGHS